MSGADKPKGYLAAFGAKLLAQGYEIIPILPRSKAPRGKEWEQLRASPKLLRGWIENGPLDGVGVLTRKTPGIDIDVRDEAMAQAVEAYARDLVGGAPMRIGLAPKRLLVCRSDVPFSKITSTSFIDPNNPVETHGSKAGKPLRTRIEILGVGQQFVAYHIHPDTKKPYRWPGGGLREVAYDDLPLITEEQGRAICAEYERLAREAGWQVFRKAQDALPARQEGLEPDEDDWTADISQKVDLTEEELVARLLMVPHPEDYDTWFQIGMALYHQFDGDARGLEIWHEWSIQADNYEQEALDKRWDTFKIEGKGRAPITAKIILKWSQAYVEKLRTETFVETKAKLEQVADRQAFREVCESIKHLEFDKLSRNELVSVAREKWKALTKSTLNLTEARDLLRYENPQIKETPWWSQNWVYCQQDEVFLHTVTKAALTKTAFNDTHYRHVLTKKDVLEGRSQPEEAPSAMALNLFQIPIVFSRMYMPGEDVLFTLNGREYVNSYDGRNVPAELEKLNRADRAAIALVEAHFTHLFTDPDDATIFKYWLAWIVQNPGKHPHWAVLIQGTEGDGKSFFYSLLCAVLAVENVRTLVGKALEEKNTAWAEGKQVVFVEEVKLAGHNRHDVLNSIKPLITNPVVAIRRMNVDWYDTLNVTSYLLATNYRDAMPLTENDRRYFVLFSNFQTLEAIESFRAANPTYYEDLFATVERGAALRTWLMSIEIPPSFKPKANAPMSQAKLEMIDYNKSDERKALDQVLEESTRADICDDLLNVTDLPDMMAEAGCSDVPFGKTMQRLLLNAGFTKIGRCRLDPKDELQTLYWTRKPRRYLDSDNKPYLARMRAWVRNGGL